MSESTFGSCPIPVHAHSEVLLGHGSGGVMSARLINEVFAPALTNPILDRGDDCAIVEGTGARLAFTTDSFVITPIVFPGGDIGELAINGTINDLAMSGSRPLYIAAAFILEEGFAIAELARIAQSMGAAARAAGVRVVAGDTKVVHRGAADKLFITTTGIGSIPDGVDIAAANVRPGDAILVSGTIADHGVAVMSAREDLGFEGALASDTAPLASLVAAMLDACPDIRSLRDPTRGGLATSLAEIAQRSTVGLAIDLVSVPVRAPVKGACEILGIDPLYVANEGKLVAFVPERSADDVLATMRAHPLGRDAVRIGVAVSEHQGVVVGRTSIGGRRVVQPPQGQVLPRIC